MSVEVAENPVVLRAHIPTDPVDLGPPPLSGELNEFSYRPVPVVSAVGLVLALMSSIGIFVWMVMPLAVVAAGLSALGLWVTLRSGGAYGGKMVAISGLLLSVAFFVGGIAFQIYTYRTEIPDGYERVHFVNDISNKGFVQEKGHMTIHPDVRALDGKKVFIKGFIYQTGQLHDLKAFMLVKDNDSCCFGANPALQDRIGVYMKDGNGIDYKAGKVAIAGEFRLNPKYDPHDDKAPIYLIEGEKFTTRVSDF